MKVLEGDDKKDAAKIKELLFDIDYQTQEVTLKKKLKYFAEFYFDDIASNDFYSLILNNCFKIIAPEFIVCTLVENEPYYEFDLRTDFKSYMNLMNSPGELGLSYPDVGLNIIYEQLLIFEKNGYWFLHADRYFDKTILYSEKPIEERVFWNGRGAEKSPFYSG